MKTKIKNLCPDCQAELVRYGRADWRCPKDGENKMLVLVLMAQADQNGGINERQN